MWLIQAFIFHILFLGSIFVIYFRSPILTNLTAQPDIENPPAKRLVLFVTDGLRASSFFKDQGKYIPHISEILLEHGILGISHTRVPTESRPGHIALIAGLYEDPSAVTRGWEENPIDFDSVFNRSQKTRAWGAHDIVSIFSKCASKGKVEIHQYKKYLDFSGAEKTYKLDDWVFTKVNKFISNGNKELLQNEERVVYFLHLLGLDSAGHIHKPNTKLFYENLLYTEEHIAKFYKSFENIFDDNRTAYVLTSDHGMTDTGSHGSGDTYETEVPLFVWGAGVNNWKQMKFDAKRKFFKMKHKKIPLYEVEQAAITPLMSSLIGVGVPMNNYGKLPGEFLNVSSKYLANAFLNNAQQMLAQYEKLLDEFESGFFSYFLPKFSQIDKPGITYFRKSSLAKINKNDFDGSIQSSKEILDEAFNGIEYYQKYYQHILLFCTTLAICGWIFNLYLILNNCKPQNSKLLYFWMFLIVKLSFMVIFLQKIPLSIGIYIVLPVICWGIALDYKLNQNPTNLKIEDYLKLVPLLIGTELLVMAFIWREIISIVFILFALLKLRTILQSRSKYFIVKWVIFTVTLSIFPMLPGVNGRRNDLFLFGGLLYWYLKLFQLKIKNILKFFYIIQILNTTFCIYLHNHLIAIPIINLVITWIIFILNFVIPMTVEKSPKIRLQYILLCLPASYSLLSVSYEPIFVLLLSSHLESLMDIINNDSKKKNLVLLQEPVSNIKDNFELAFITLLYTLFSFLGSGNIASVSSFDINCVRCFISVFSPFIIMILIILKLSLPIIIIAAVISRLLSLKMNSDKREKKLFICILIICNLMGISCLFLVTNQGSWLDIGQSISRFVIMQVTTLVLFIINGIVMAMFNLEINYNTLKCKFNKLKDGKFI